MSITVSATTVSKRVFVLVRFIFEKELLDALADMIQEQLDTTLGQYSLGLENLTKEAEEQKNIEAKILSRKQEIQQLRTTSADCMRA